MRSGVLLSGMAIVFARKMIGNFAGSTNGHFRRSQGQSGNGQPETETQMAAKGIAAAERGSCQLRLVARRMEKGENRSTRTARRAEGIARPEGITLYRVFRGSRLRMVSIPQMDTSSGQRAEQVPVNPTPTEGDRDRNQGKPAGLISLEETRPTQCVHISRGPRWSRAKEVLS